MIGIDIIPMNLYFFQALLAEFNRFRVEDVPPRLNQKQKLGHLYDELQVGGTKYQLKRQNKQSLVLQSDMKVMTKEIS